MGNGATKVWIRKRNTKGGTSYSLRWREEGRMRSESLGRVGKEHAEKKRIEKEYELAFSSPEDRPRDIGWKGFVEDHLRYVKAKKSEGTHTIEERLLTQIGDYLEPEKLSDVTYHKLERFFTHRRLDDEVSPATLNKQIRTLRSILSRAVKLNYLSENPAKKLDFWREPERTNRVPSAGEVKKLLDAAPDRQWKTFLYLAVSCGLRVGELCNLQWLDVDLEKGILTVQNRSHWQTKGGKNRTLGLNEQARELLGGLKQRASDSEFIFVTSEGNPWGNNVQRGFRRIRKKAKIRHCTLHDLRRTFCTEVSKKMPPKVLKDLAGHSNISVTEEYYLASTEEKQAKEAAEGLPY